MRVCCGGGGLSVCVCACPCAQASDSPVRSSLARTRPRQEGAMNRVTLHTWKRQVGPGEQRRTRMMNMHSLQQRSVNVTPTNKEKQVYVNKHNTRALNLHALVFPFSVRDCAAWAAGQSLSDCRPVTLSLPVRRSACLLSKLVSQSLRLSVTSVRNILFSATLRAQKTSILFPGTLS